MYLIVENDSDCIDKISCFTSESNHSLTTSQSLCVKKYDLKQPTVVRSPKQKVKTTYSWKQIWSWRLKDYVT